MSLYLVAGVGASTRRSHATRSPAQRPYPPVPVGHDRRGAADGTVNRIHNALRGQVRTIEGRDPDPSAALVDSQSVRAAESVTTAQRGYDAGKKINGRKRHIATDTTGLLLVVMVTAASVQDRDAGRLLIGALHTCFRRWVVERTLSWIPRCRRTIRYYKLRPEHHAAIIQWSMIIITTRRLARYHRT